MARGARTLAIPLTMLQLSTADEEFDGEHCLDCDLSLDLHQPDTGSPGRLIGICGACGRWYLIDAVAEATDAVMVLLPGGESFLNALRGHPT
jgi:hypothetical protein